jgi:hypothetical protein
MLKMIRGSIEQCPDTLWSAESLKPRFWQEVYHALYYLDFYLGNDYDNYQPRFEVKESLNEVPETVLSKEELLDFTAELRKQCDLYFDSLSSSDLEGKNTHPWTGKTVTHKLLYNLRHSTHHMGKLSALLKQNEVEPFRWVTSPEKQS